MPQITKTIPDFVPKTTLPSDQRIYQIHFSTQKNQTKFQQTFHQISLFSQAFPNKYLQTPDQTKGSQRNQVSCCSFFCACKLSSRSCCLRFGAQKTELKDHPQLPARGPNWKDHPVGRGYVVSNPFGKCHQTPTNKASLTDHNP